MKLIPKSKWGRIRLSVLFLILSSILLWGGGWFVVGKVRYEPHEGDVLFQQLPNPEGLDLVDAIEGVSGSPYSHCGVVVKRHDGWFVLEGMTPVVQEISLNRWLMRGSGRFATYRLKKEHRSHIPEWIKEMRKMMGRPYDFRYRLTDEEVYCSELPFTAWKNLRAEEMGKLTKLGDLNWQPYRQVIVDLEESSEIPIDRIMITPKNLAQANQLEFVMANGLKRE